MNKEFLSLCAAAMVCTGSVSQSIRRQQNDSTIIQELDEVVISDSRFELKRENSGKTVIKISAEEMERNRGKDVAQIINTKSGLEIAGSRGRQGSVLGVFGRGGRGRQVLVLVDGVRVSDPSSFGSEYDLRLLETGNIASIEIIKGAASTLYGTNAATAVINITTKKAAKKDIALNVTSSSGTNQTAENQNYNLSRFSNSARLSGTARRFTYLAGVSNSFSEGLSDLIGASEKDGFSRLSTDVRLGYRILDKFNLTVFGNQTKMWTSFDESSTMMDAPYSVTTEQKRAGLSSVFGYTNGSLTGNVAYSDYDTESISAFPSDFLGSNLVLDVFNKYNINDKWYTVIGLNYLEDKIEAATNEQFTIADPYANVVFISGFGLNLNAGVRFNNHSEYGNNFVYNINPSFSLAVENGYLKVLGSYATSYITPNLTQLFGAFGANPNLQPEENRTVEGGLEYAITGKLRASALYFNRKEENFITFDSNFTSANAEDTLDAQGVEVEVDWTPTDKLIITANYTFTERKGDPAIRRPKHKVNTIFDYKFSDRWVASLTYQLTGKRLDTDFNNPNPDFSFPNNILDAYSLVGLYLSYEALPGKLNLFMNADNLLNENYTEVLGFTTLGRNFRIGLNLKL